MKMRLIVGLFGAVALAAGSTAAHAIMMVDARDGNPKMGARSVTYAKETLLKSSADPQVSVITEVDDATYYNIQRMHHASGPAEVEGAASSEYYVSFVLNNMVFRTALTDESLTVYDGGADDDDDVLNDNNAISGTTFTRHAGGLVGDDSVVFKLTEMGVHPKNWLSLAAEYAISASGGGITRTVTNVTLSTANVPGIKPIGTHSLPSAVKASPALREAIDASDSDQLARASHEFMSFSTTRDPDDRLSASVGSISLAVVGAGDDDDDKRFRDAQTTNAELSGGNAGVVATLLDITVAHEDDDGDLTNTVTFSGDFSFAKAAGFADTLSTSGCSDITEVRKPDEADPEILTDEVVAQSADEFDDGSVFLCVEVDGETAMTDTDYYMVTTKYKGRAMAAYPPAGGTHNLARIRRDGYSAAIPYLTTHEAYNQRVVIVNRWRETMYAFTTFAHEVGVEVTDGAMASGTLPTGTTVLRVDDIVTIDGASRASAILTVVAPESYIDAAVQQVNLEDRGVDTVYLNP